MTISETQWRNLNSKLDAIMEQVNAIKKTTQKRGLTFEAALPPHLVCFDVINSNNLQTLQNPMQILSDYYGVETMENYINTEKVPNSAIACYHPSEKTAYYPDNSAGLDVTLHEFFHHLVAQGVVHLEKGQHEEHWANKFAEIVIQRGNDCLR